MPRKVILVAVVVVVGGYGSVDFNGLRFNNSST